MNKLTLLFSALAGIVLGMVCWTKSVLGETAENSSWPRFRGENGTGVLAECKVRLPWTPDQVQRVKLPGTGNGSPILVNGQAFLLSAETKDATRHVVTIDLKDNKIAWTKSFPSKTHGLHKYSSYASSTPCTDGKSLFVAWADPQNVIVKSFSFQGEEKWSRSLGRYVSQHGFGTSPMIVDGKVILLNSQDAEELPPGVEPGQDKMMAFDSETGATVWETPLPTTRVCYGVPCVRRKDGRTELVCSTTGEGMFGMDANDGKVLWSHDCFNQRVCSSSVLIGDLLIGTHGSGAGKDNRLFAWDIGRSKERFQVTRAAPYVPTPVSVDGLLLLWSDNGIVSCVDIETGETLWRERIGGDYSGSPVVLGKVWVNGSHDGTVTFLAATREFQKLGMIETGQTIRSTIAADANHVLLRTDQELWIVR